MTQRVGRLIRLPRQDAELGSLDLFARLDRGGAESIRDPRRIEEVLETIRGGLNTSLENPARLHGWRVQSMFEGLLAALGDAVLVKVEDSGDCYFRDDAPIAVPDLRVVSSTGEHLLIEVKNHRPDPRTPFRANSAYLERLLRYGKLTGGRPKIAVYWSRINVWTLTDVSGIPRDKAKAVLPIEAAAKSNEMSILGDRMIGIRPPLEFVIEAASPATIADDGMAPFQIGRVKLLNGGRVIRRKKEQRLAWYILLNGPWPQETPADVRDGQLHGMSIRAQPEEGMSKHGFALVGWLSELYSTSYRHRTSGEEGLNRLRAVVRPEELRQLLPVDYKGVDLPVWIFNVQASKQA